jgi:2-oxo-3-hexenedioate decarboxylase
MTRADIDALAGRILAAYDARLQIPSICAESPNFDLTQAYAVTAAVRRMRETRGEKPIGRKLGFTNSTIWDEYRVYAPIWGYVYNTTVTDISKTCRGVIDLTRVVEPRIEPEITLAFKRSPEPGMDERAILECIDWVAHGFEVVQSLFPGWRFSAPDTVAAFGLHGALILGPRHRIHDANLDEWLAILKTFQIALHCGDDLVDRGVASNVLGGPLSALRYTIEVLASDPDHPQIAAGEIVTTGTVTRAFPISGGQTWYSEFPDAPFEALTIETV